jgi:1-deoxy-D-xylulose-5-phosphate reductoisomerase
VRHPSPRHGPGEPAGDPSDHPGDAPAVPVGVALLGSTGSIGRQALDVLESAGRRTFRVVALAAGRDHAALAAQLARVRPALAALDDEVAARSLEVPAGTRLLRGPEALELMATHEDVDLVVVATSGIVSLRPVLAALEAGKVVATANKETLVAGGHLVMPLARARATKAARADPSDVLASPLAWLRPIDSEHSAIWQCLVGERTAAVERLILTASGGPFRTWPKERLATARPEDALAHPTWQMGAKITIDSATLMNKGLEILEAGWLYDVPLARIDVVIHPQSLVHSLVEFVDGSLKAQLGLPDMRIPIQYALTYPRRRTGHAARLDLLSHGELTFEAPDAERFPALEIARSAGALGARACAALIAADDVAVRRFLSGSLSFLDVSRLAAAAVERYGEGPDPDLATLIELDAEVRDWSSRTEVMP